jgi:hypothetical protein
MGDIEVMTHLGTKRLNGAKCRRITLMFLIPLAIAAHPAAAAAQVIVPAGCGSFSNQPVPAGWGFADFSGSNVPLGGASPHVFAPTGNPIIIVLTRFSDHVQGSTDPEVICGGPGADVINGGDGDDELHGNAGSDTLSGQAGSDFLSGEANSDELHGNDPLNSNANFDRSDVLHGGDGDDFLFGGGFGDELRGGPGTDSGDGQAGNDSCFGIELETSCE